MHFSGQINGRRRQWLIVYTDEYNMPKAFTRCLINRRRQSIITPIYLVFCGCPGGTRFANEWPDHSRRGIAMALQNSISNITRRVLLAAAASAALALPAIADD